MRGVERVKLELGRSVRPFIWVLALCTAGGIAFAVVFKNLTFERPWADYRVVRAEFDDVKGVFPGGHQVRIHGVRVGVVSDAKLVGGRAVLTLKIEHKWGPIYRDARLRIRPVTPLQDLYVNVVDRGTPRAGEANADTIIRADRTETPVDISRVLNTFNADTRQRMTMLLSALGPALQDGGNRLRASFAELAPFLHVAQRATRVLAERRRNVARIVDNFGALSGALAKRDQALNRLVLTGNATLGELANNDQALGQTFTEIAQLLPVMRSSFVALRGLSGELDPALRDLTPVTRSLASGLKGLQEFGRDAQPALAALRPAVRDLRGMSRQLSPTSRALASSFDTLAREAPQIDALTRELPPCMKTLSDFFNNTLSVFKLQDSNGSFPRADEIVDLDTGQVPGAKPGVSTVKMPTCADGKGG